MIPYVLEKQNSDIKEVIGLVKNESAFLKRQDIGVGSVCWKVRLDPNSEAWNASHGFRAATDLCFAPSPIRSQLFTG